MSGKSPLKFLIPESSCQQDFSVFARYADGTKEKVLRCDWFDKYLCDSAPGYTHTIENDTALITVAGDLKKESEVFICEPYFQHTPDTKRCFCTMHVPAVIPVQPDSDSPGQVALIAGLSAGLVLLLLVVVGCLIYKRYCRRTSSKSTQAHKREFDEYELLKHQNSRLKQPRPPPIAFSTLNKETPEAFFRSDPAIEMTRKDVPHISATYSQKSLLTFFPCRTVPSRKMPMTQKPHPELYNTRRLTI